MYSSYCILLSTLTLGSGSLACLYSRNNVHYELPVTLIYFPEVRVGEGRGAPPTSGSLSGGATQPRALGGRRLARTHARNTILLPRHSLATACRRHTRSDSNLRFRLASPTDHVEAPSRAAATRCGQVTLLPQCCTFDVVCSVWTSRAVSDRDSPVRKGHNHAEQLCTCPWNKRETRSSLSLSCLDEAAGGTRRAPHAALFMCNASIRAM